MAPLIHSPTANHMFKHYHYFGLIFRVLGANVGLIIANICTFDSLIFDRLMFDMTESGFFEVVSRI